MAFSGTSITKNYNLFCHKLQKGISELMQNISADLIAIIAYTCLYMLVNETKMCPGKVSHGMHALLIYWILTYALQINSNNY